MALSSFELFSSCSPILRAALPPAHWQEDGPGVVEIDHRHEVEPRSMHLPRHRTAQSFDLRRRRGRHPAGDRDRPADDTRRRLRLVAVGFFPSGGGTLELQDVLHRQPIERDAVLRALQKIEQREPREHRKLRVAVLLDAFFELPAGVGRVAAGNSEAPHSRARRTARIGLRDLERGTRRRPLRKACAGTVMSSPAGSTCRRAFAAAVAASSRADVDAGELPASRARVSSWAVAWKKTTFAGSGPGSPRRRNFSAMNASDMASASRVHRFPPPMPDYRPSGSRATSSGDQTTREFARMTRRREAGAAKEEHNDEKSARFDMGHDHLRFGADRDPVLRSQKHADVTGGKQHGTRTGSRAMASLSGRHHVDRPALLLQLRPGSCAQGSGRRQHGGGHHPARRSSRSPVFPLVGRRHVARRSGAPRSNFVTPSRCRRAIAGIGIGAWLGTIMLINVWALIWPNQQKILGLKPATDEEKTKARRVALLASRTNMMLSMPMLFFMAGGLTHKAAFGL
jgi:hypothetical protein